MISIIFKHQKSIIIQKCALAIIYKWREKFIRQHYVKPKIPSLIPPHLYSSPFLSEKFPPLNLSPR